MRSGGGRFASALVRLILLGGFATAGYGIYAWNTANAEEYAQLDSLARFAAKSASLFFDRFNDTLEHLGQDIIDQGGVRDLRAAHTLLARYQQHAPAVAAANLFDLNGNWLLSSGKAPGTVLPSLKQVPEWEAEFKIAVESSGLSVGRPIPGVIVPERVIPLKRTVRTSSGSRLFVLSAVVPLRNQQKIWNNLELPEDAVIGIVRSDGYFQSRFPGEQDEARVYSNPWRGPVTEAAFGATPSNTGHVEAASPLDGVYRIVSYQRLDGYPLAAYVGVPRTRMWLAWVRLVQVPFALFALLAIGGIVISRHLTLQYEDWGRVLNARQRRLELLNLISSDVNAGTPFLKLVDEVLQQLANQLPHLRVSYAVLDASSKLVPVCACANVDCEYAGGSHLDLSGAPALTLMLQSGRPIAIGDTAADPRVAPIAEALRAAKIRSWLLLSMMHAGELVGLLSIESHIVHEWSEDFAALSGDVAAQLSVALTESRAAEQRMHAVAELEQSRERFRSLAEMSSDWFWEQDAELRFTYVSPGAQLRLLDRPAESLGMRRWEIPFIEGVTREQWDEHKAQLEAQQPFSDFLYRYRFRGEMRYASISGKPMFDAQGQFVGYRGIGKDITAQRENEARIHYLARNDELTGLANRSSFQEQLTHAIRQSQRHGRAIALLFIDLDRFKNINDSLGHQVGDQLLKQVGARMLDCIRKGDTLSRLGGDEFVVTLEGLQQAEDAAQVAAKIIKALSRPFEISGHTLNTSCSIGISIFPLDADDDRALMKNADTAMYHAKEKGRNNYQFFSPEMNTRAVERHTLETALRQAIEQQQFKLYYQPQVDMRSGKVVGMEALLRWDHPQRGLLAPGTFIAVAEESGLIDPIGQWVLRNACQRAKAWQDAGYPAVKIAVNISARQLMRPREFARGLARVLSATGLEPCYLELEMTESLLVHNAEENIAVLRKLGQDGMRIAVDDFGTGYSSLSYLRQLPIDTLKIDRTFVRDVESDPEDAAIIQAIVAMAHSLGLQVTAEGVETRGQLEALGQIGCDEYQGYLFSRPLPAVEIAARFLAPRELDFEVAAKRRDVGT